MNINWFPGHMAKALRSMAEEVKNVDMILYVLDARAPFSTINPEFLNIINNKPVLYIINKSDLVESESLKDFINKFKGLNREVICLNSTQNGANRIIEPIMKTLCHEKLQKYKNKGLNMNLRAMVIGVPNSGKSTLINNLCGIKKAITGDKAGVTRGKQWVSLKNGFELLDTPGTLYPNLENKQIALNLAIIGSVKNEVLDMGEISLELIGFLKKYYPNLLITRYSLKSIECENLQILEEIAKNKHLIQKGNEIDYERTSFMIIDDFRKGRLGKIMLDR